MAIEQGLLQLIQADSGVSAQVTMTGGKGVYWILMPKGAAYPCIVLSRIATADTIAFEGDKGFRGALFQVDCYASQFLPSRAIAQAVRNLLKSYKGNLPDVDSTAVAGVIQTKDWDMQYEEGEKGFVYRALLEFRVWYYDSTLPVTPTSNGPGIIDGGQS